MKNILLIVMLLMNLTAFSQSEKNLVKSFHVIGSLSVELPGKVNIINWDKNYIQINTFVTVYTNESNTNKLVSLGRYDIVVLDSILSMPKYKNGITIKDEDIRESFVFEIKVPNGLQLTNKNEINQ